MFPLDVEGSTPRISTRTLKVGETFARDLHKEPNPNGHRFGHLFGVLV